MIDQVVMGIFGTFALIIGAALGSFCKLAIDRLPNDRSVVTPRSFCNSCQTPVAAWDNIPVVSYLLLNGQCRHCEAPIGRASPLVEALTALLGLLLFWRIFPGPEAIDYTHWAAWSFYMIFLCALVIATYVDIRHWIIPDETTIYLAPVGILGAALLGELAYDGAMAMPWREAVFGACMCAGFFGTASVLAFVVLRREGMGWGDVKLMTMVGAFLGYQAVGAMLFGTLIGSVVAFIHLVWAQKRTYLPAGPSLAAGAVVMLLYGDAIAEMRLQIPMDSLLWLISPERDLGPR